MDNFERKAKFCCKGKILIHIFYVLLYLEIQSLRAPIPRSTIFTCSYTQKYNLYMLLYLEVQSLGAPIPRSTIFTWSYTQKYNLYMLLYLEVQSLGAPIPRSTICTCSYTQKYNLWVAEHCHGVAELPLGAAATLLRLLSRVLRYTQSLHIPKTLFVLDIILRKRKKNHRIQYNIIKKEPKILFIFT